MSQVFIASFLGCLFAYVVIHMSFKTYAAIISRRWRNALHLTIPDGDNPLLLAQRIAAEQMKHVGTRLNADDDLMVAALDYSEDSPDSSNAALIENLKDAARRFAKTLSPEHQKIIREFNKEQRS